MATQFIKSTEIEVFPAVHRSNDHTKSKRTTEENLTKFAKLSSNKTNLSQMFLDPDDNSFVIFNIAGYWFRCSQTNIPAGNDLYAYIALKEDPNIGYMLTPTDSLTLGGTLDAIVGSDTEESFKGLAFDTALPTDSEALYYGLKIKNGSALTFQNLKLDASEVRNTTRDDATKSISEEFDTGELVATTVNGLIIDSTTGTLDIADGKSLIANADLTIGTSSGNTGEVKIQSAGSSPTTITGPNNGTTILLSGEMVEKNAAQTLTQKTFVAPVLGAATATSINKVTITPPTTSSVLRIADGKSLIANANLTIGGTSSNSGDITIKSSTANDSTITAPGNGSVTLFAGDMVEKDKMQTLTQKTLTTPILTTPKINSLTAEKTYNVAASSLIASRTITLPSLTGNDEFVFKDFTQTITNKTLTSPIINSVDINGGTAHSLTSFSIRDTSAEFDVTIAGTSSTTLTAGRTLTVDIANADKTIKLTGSPTLSGITTTGSGTLALGNKTLTANSSITLDGTDNKTLTVNDNATLGTNAITLASNKSLTMQYAGLTVGDSAGTGLITIKSNNSIARSLTLQGSPTLIGDNTLTLTNASLTVGDYNGTGKVTIKTSDSTGRSLTLTGSPTLSAITTTGSGILALGTKTLTVGSTLTLTGADNSTIDFGGGGGTGTVAYTSNKLNAFTSTSSSELAGVISNKTGSGNLVFATSPALITPSLGAATATSINKVAITSPLNGATLTIGDGKTATISDTITINKPLTVGSLNTYTGGVTVQSAGSSPTIIRGPDNGTIILPPGTALVNSGSKTAGSFDTLSVNPTNTNRLNYDGYLYATRMYSDAFYAHSDERLKENIIDYKYHDSILDIAVKEFDYKETGTHAIGFIAQELQAKFPELVTSDDSGYLAISESKLVYLLLEEVKLLKEEIRKLKE